MPWPALVGLDQLSYGVLSNYSTGSALGFSVIHPGSTAATAAAVGQRVLAVFRLGSTGYPAMWIPGVDVQATILTAGRLSILATEVDNARSLIVVLMPVTP